MTLCLTEFLPQEQSQHSSVTRPTLKTTVILQPILVVGPTYWGTWYNLKRHLGLRNGTWRFRYKWNQGYFIINEGRVKRESKTNAIVSVIWRKKILTSVRLGFLGLCCARKTVSFRALLVPKIQRKTLCCMQDMVVPYGRKDNGIVEQWWR